MCGSSDTRAEGARDKPVENTFSILISGDCSNTFSTFRLESISNLLSRFLLELETG